MKNNLMIGLASGLYLLSGTIQAKDEPVDYPTVSYPSTSLFEVSKEKAFYHLTWEVAARENLSYTEIQGSIDGKNFTTVGYLVSDGTTKTTFDYFVPSEKYMSMTHFRLVQHGLNSEQYISEVKATLR